MAYSITYVKNVSPDLMRELAGDERFVTHAHAPCVVDILHQTFGWEGGAFLVSEGEKTLAYLPCMFINGRLVSMPHFSFGGLVSCCSNRDEIYSEVLPKIHAYFTGTYKAEVPYLLRETQNVGNFVPDNKVISWLDIQGKAIAQVIPAAQTGRARKALENDLTCRQGGMELLDDFYRVYARNMLRLGSPVLPRRLFANILSGYTEGDSKIFCVYKQNAPVGAAFLLSYLGFYENTWFSTLHTYNRFYPGALLHTEMISFALQQGGHTYSFGRSTAGSGVHEFKRRWGTTDTVVYWNYDKPPKMNLRKVGWLANAWKLLPVAVANTLGPLFARKIY